MKSGTLKSGTFFPGSHAASGKLMRPAVKDKGREEVQGEQTRQELGHPCFASPDLLCTFFTLACTKSYNKGLPCAAAVVSSEMEGEWSLALLFTWPSWQVTVCGSISPCICPFQIPGISPLFLAALGLCPHCYKP